MEEAAMRKVIAALDNSAAPVPVLAAARALAPVLGANVEAIQVLTDGPGRTAEASASSYHVPFTTIRGDPLDTLTHVAEDTDVVAFALGARGSPGGRRPAGHLALELADHVDTPVVIVPPDATPGP